MNLLSILANLFILTFLGLLIAFSPILIIVNFIIVLTTKRPILNSLIFILGVTIPLLILAAIADIFINPSSNIKLGTLLGTIHLPAFLNVLLGVVLLYFGVNRLIHYRENDRSSKVTPIVPPTDNLKSLFTFAFVKSLLSITNIFAIFVIVNNTKVHNLSPALGVIVLLWAIFIGLLPLFLTLYYQQYQPRMLERLNQRINDTLKNNLQLMITILLLSLGVYFLIIGLRGF